MTAPPGRALRLKIELAAPLLRRAAVTFWTTGDPRLRYVSYAQAMHAVIRASVPLMELAAGRCEALAPADPPAALIGVYLRDHISEELHHDDWLAEDLGVTGVDPAALLATAPTSAAVASLVGAQYYWILHRHPASLLGYIGAIESTGPSPQMTRWLADATGFPSHAFRTLEHHARVDPAHTAGLYDLLDRLDLDSQQAAAVGCGALHAVASLAALLTSLASSAIPQERSHAHGRR